MKRKWNWIDSTILILILIAIFGFINRDKILGGSSDNASNRKNILFTVAVEDLDESMITDLKVGDKIFSQNQLQKAEIREVTVLPRTKAYLRDDGSIIELEEAEGINIEVEIHAEVVTSGPYMDLGGQEVKAGLPFILKTTSVEYLGQIKDAEVK